MPPDPSKLIAALPPDLLEQAPSPREQLGRMLADLESKPPPAGRLARLWNLGSLPSAIALGYLAYWIRSGFVSGTDVNRS